MPRVVDHLARRQELARAAAAVVVRDGVDGTTLRSVATEAGWSVGALQHYFATRDQLLAAALDLVGSRIDARVTALPESESALGGLRAAVVELLPLDADRRDETRLWLAFVSRAGVDPSLAPAAEDIWRAINAPLTARLLTAADRGELRDGINPRAAALGLQALLDGLCLQLITTPGVLSRTRAMAALDAQLDGLRAARSPAPRR